MPRIVGVNVAAPAPVAVDHEKAKPHKQYPSNATYTTKYNLVTFIPQNLYEQFRRLANFYFLLLVTLQFIPRFQVSNPYYAAAPITGIVLLTAIKDGVEDWRRRVHDGEINRTLVSVLTAQNYNALHQTWLQRFLSRCVPSLFPARTQFDQSVQTQWERREWQAVQVGDLILIKDGEAIPADVILLNSSEDESICYIETKNLDGETNLKIRSGLKESRHVTDDSLEAARFTATIEAEAPNINLYALQGAMRVHGSDQVLPLTINNLLLRGSVLRNTKWAVAVVVFTGVDTKIVMNSGRTPSKRSSIEKLMNWQVLINVTTLFCVCMIIAIGYAARYLEHQTALYLVSRRESVVNVAANAATVFVLSLIMMQNFVPISLYVTLEIVKAFQALLIYMDLDLYYEEYDAPCMPRSWTIADDLGQIEYVFSDKTGTLTKNQMEFRKCSINGVSYGTYDSTESDADGEEENKLSAKMMLSLLNNVYQNPYRSANAGTFNDEHFAEDMATAEDDQSQAIRAFFTHIAVCHTVLPEYGEDASIKSALRYMAQSPDEAALVDAARFIGITFTKRAGDYITVDVLGKDVQYEVLEFLEFSSARKRMSVIARDCSSGRVMLYCKGADTVIFERLADGQNELMEATSDHLEEYANDGLRTLCIACRELKPQELESWRAKYNSACAQINDRDEAVERVAEEVETNLQLLGATAIEDELQDGVPDCIADIAKAGVKLWVLTGDKLETAVNIGFSSRLLTQDMTVIMIKALDEKATIMQLQYSLFKYLKIECRTFMADEIAAGTFDVRHLQDNIQSPAVSSKVLPKIINSDINVAQKYAVVIDGQSLAHATQGAVAKMFVELTSRANAVICCRVSPKQKAQVVELIKKSKHAMTLAIGDGANDVSMIQKANVGVGIQGKEGMQAVMSSDYAFAQFRFLKKLLLVHGRWSYFRIAQLTLLMFYKNMVWAVVLFWYQFYCDFTAQILYNYLHILFYNLFYTGLPPIIIGAFDQDINAALSMLVPEIYIHGINQEKYGLKLFFLYILDGIFQSLVCFYVPYLTLSETSIHFSGHAPDIGLFGMMSAFSAVLVSNLYMGFNNMSWSKLFVFSFCIGPFIFMVFTAAGSFFLRSGMFGILDEICTSPTFWLAVVLTVVISMLPKIAFTYFYTQVQPTDVELLREMTNHQLLGHLNPKLKERGRTPLLLGLGEPTDDIEMDYFTTAPSRRSRHGTFLKRNILDPVRQSFRNIRHMNTRASADGNMEVGGTLQRNRGFAFSQEAGIATHLRRHGTASNVTTIQSPELYHAKTVTR